MRRSGQRDYPCVVPPGSRGDVSSHYSSFSLPLFPKETHVGSQLRKRRTRLANMSSFPLQLKNPCTFHPLIPLRNISEHQPSKAESWVMMAIVCLSKIESFGKAPMRRRCPHFQTRLKVQLYHTMVCSGLAAPCCNRNIL
jgi:hypothetical protein